VSDEARAAQAALQTRGRRWLARSRAIDALTWALGLAGLAIVAHWSLRRRIPAPPAERAGDVSWTAPLVLGVLIRAEFWYRLYYVALAEVSLHLGGTPFVGPIFDSGIGTALFAWGTLFASLPGAWLVYTHLLPPPTARQHDLFGLCPSAAEVPTLVAVGLAAIAINLVGVQLVGIASWELGWFAHWSEGFDEALIWGDPWELSLNVTDLCLWAPGFEELMYRGVLFLWLRGHWGPGAAAVASSAVFSAFHFYGVSGFLVTFWGGFVWALAFDRTRSLLPGIAAHSIYNLLYVLGLVLIYR
jgi:membrane protease YdiL (CAAX protease family)